MVSGLKIHQPQECRECRIAADSGWPAYPITGNELSKAFFSAYCQPFRTWSTQRFNDVQCHFDRLRMEMDQSVPASDCLVEGQVFLARCPLWTDIEHRPFSFPAIWVLKGDMRPPVSNFPVQLQLSALKFFTLIPLSVGLLDASVPIRRGEN